MDFLFCELECWIVMVFGGVCWEVWGVCVWINKNFVIL